ncbi:MAG: efflux RND transporter periplasmic adaptor subunit [Myxococcota bacterium]
MKIHHTHARYPLMCLICWLILLGGSLPACQPSSAQHEEHPQNTLYTCPMHPSIRQDHPGKCPLCGMDLQPLQSGSSDGSGRTSSSGNGTSSAPARTHTHEGQSTLSSCPMHPSIRQDHSGKCPLCGMDLQPLSTGHHGAPTQDGDPTQVVTLDAHLLHRIGLSTTPATPRTLTDELRVPARLILDERRIKRVSARVMGRIEKLYANSTGMEVQAGQPLLELYSPMVLSAQQEYLLAHHTDENSAVTQAARLRLERLGMTRAQLTQLLEQNRPLETLTVVSPSRGTLLEKMAIEGAYVEEGMPLFELADLSSIWVQASVYERDLVRFKRGDPAEIEVPILPGQRLSSRVELIAPMLDEMTGTAKLRLSLSNPAGLLRPGMSAEVLLRSSQAPVLSVPSTALVRTGPEALVFVQVEANTFQPRRVKLGLEQEGYVQVLDGLHEGEPVVSTGAFLLDAQTQITGGQSLLYSAATELKSTSDKKAVGPAKTSGGRP